VERRRYLDERFGFIFRRSIDNIREDRDKAKEFLEQLEEVVILNDTYSLKQLGLVAAKYLETLQRSNEQLVKVAALLQKSKARARFY
jgi:hypothetical protein